MEVVDDEHGERDRAAHRGHRQERATRALDRGRATLVAPPCKGDQEEREGPGHVEKRSLGVRAAGGLEQVDAVTEREDGERCADQQPGTTRPPARERERAHDEREQKHVPEGVREVRRDGRKRPFCRVEHRVDEHRARERCRSERRRHPVDPQSGARTSNPRPEQDDDTDVARRVEGEVEPVGERRVRRAVELREHEQPGELRHAIGAHGDCDRRPPDAMRRDEGACDGERHRGEDQRVVDAVVEEPAEPFALVDDRVQGESGDPDPGQDLERRDDSAGRNRRHRLKIGSTGRLLERSIRRRARRGSVREATAPGGIEPPHAGSKPAALSTELRGQGIALRFP